VFVEGPFSLSEYQSDFSTCHCHVVTSVQYSLEGYFKQF